MNTWNIHKRETYIRFLKVREGWDPKGTWKGYV